MEYLIGALVTLVFCLVYFYGRLAGGILRIDHSNPEKDVYRFEINNLDKLNKKRRIVLKIDHKADLSSK